LVAASVLIWTAEGHLATALSRRATSAPTDAGSAVAAWRDAHPPTESDPRALGPVSAPVVVVEWGDFQCPFCRAFASDIQPALVRDYVSTGAVRLEWRDLPTIGPESVLAARAARAASQQGAFWSFHDQLYEHQGPENSGTVTEDFLRARALEAGLDIDRFTNDVNFAGVADAVDGDRRDAERLGISHVPSFLINGQLLIGAQTLDTLRAVIDAALPKAH
jgi:protein-disulfide isomerase